MLKDPEKGAQWTNRRLAARWLRSPVNASRFVSWAERGLSQANIDAIEGYMFPPPTAEEKLTELQRLSKDLERLGYEEGSDLLQAVETEAARLRASAEDREDTGLRET